MGATADRKGASAAQVREPAVNLTKGLNNRFQLGPARKAPVVSMVLGMAGSGKTTLMQRIAVHIYEKQTPSYIINLDPAVSSVPYGCNIDIRDTVNYKEVMKQYQLGPNGGIMTALNLFATKFDQVMSLVEAKADALEHVFIDTPGQIEIFTWSASGTIISDMLAYSFPTVLLYVIDTPRTTSPVTFMSNMLYACSIMYKFKLPFIVVFNKTDITSADFALEWMTDYEKFQQAVAGETAYAGSLSSSMGLVLDEFYHNITAVAVSAVTGEGMDELFAKIDIAAEEYHVCVRLLCSRARRGRAPASTYECIEYRARTLVDTHILMQSTVLTDTYAAGISTDAGSQGARKGNPRKKGAGAKAQAHAQADGSRRRGRRGGGGSWTWCCGAAGSVAARCRHGRWGGRGGRGGRVGAGGHWPEGELRGCEGV